MRRPLLAAVTALAALAAVPAPSQALAPGAGAAVIPATSLRRPTDGVLAVGVCSYAGQEITASGAIVTVGTPLAQTTLTVACNAYDAYGNWVGGVTSNLLDPGIPVSSASDGMVSATAVRICGTVYAESRTWQARGSGCSTV
jgi:hypothetical protein